MCTCVSVCSCLNGWDCPKVSVSMMDGNGKGGRPSPLWLVWWFRTLSCEEESLGAALAVCCSFPCYKERPLSTTLPFLDFIYLYISSEWGSLFRVNINRNTVSWGSGTLCQMCQTKTGRCSQPQMLALERTARGGGAVCLAVCIIKWPFPAVIWNPRLSFPLLSFTFYFLWFYWIYWGDVGEYNYISFRGTTL